MKCESTNTPNGKRCNAPAHRYTVGMWRCLRHLPAPTLHCSHSLAPSETCAYCGGLKVVVTDTVAAVDEATP